MTVMTFVDKISWQIAFQYSGNYFIFFVFFFIPIISSLYVIKHNE